MALTDNLVAYWKMDESSGTAIDSVGGYNLTNSSTTYSYGKINNGAVFNGSSSSLNNSTKLVSLASGAGMSASCWMKLSGSGSSQFALDIVSTDNLRRVTIDKNASNTISAFLYGGSVNRVSSSYTVDTTNTIWYHVAITKTPGELLSLYVNGGLVGTVTVSGTVSLGSSGGVSVGKHASVSANFLNGSIDEVGIWSRAISASEVTDIYNQGIGKQYPFNLPMVEYAIVAGGGGGGTNGGGGGGGGGVILSGTPISPGSYSVTVGTGGNGGINSVDTTGTSGGNSSFNSVTAIGGGGGGSRANTSGFAGLNGGSGGGGASNGNEAGGTGTSGQGNNGGTGFNSGVNSSGAGGGGATAIGSNGASNLGGNGGAGISSSITGSSVTYGGGGGGGVTVSGTGGSGGSGGGGHGGGTSNTGLTAGTDGTGGGGGGYGPNFPTSGTGNKGGNGIVIIRYITGTMSATGGTITTSGSYTIHSFTSSGTFNYSTGINNSFLLFFQ